MTDPCPSPSRGRQVPAREILPPVEIPAIAPVLALVGVLAFASVLFLVSWPAWATVPLTGEFRATQACPLFRSIRNGTQVEGTRLVPGQTYPLLGKNREEATHVLIRVPGLEAVDIWVEVGCGDLSVPGQGTEDPAPAQAPAATGSALAPGDFVLAATWHPAFCEIQSTKPECAPTANHSAPRSNSDRFGVGPIPPRSDAAPTPERSVPAPVQGQPVKGQGFALHGLWPQPRERAFCRVPAGERAHAEEGRWSRLPALELSAATRQRLSVLMPGVASHLDRYQWSKHGSCQDAPPEDYFRAALDVLEQLNASAVTGLFADRVGERLRIGEIRTAFDRAFGPGAGQRVGLSCREDLIVELRLSLRGQPGAAPLGDLLRAAPVQASGCEGGYVDAPGHDPR